MDKKALYKKAEKALNQAFETAKKSAQVVSVKAGEAAHITKLMVQKATLEHRVTKQFAALGSFVYEKSEKEESKSVLFSDPAVKTLLDQTKKLAAELAHVEATLTKERKNLVKKKS